MRISDGDLSFFKEHGYVVIEGFLSPSELKAAQENFHRYYPTAEEFEYAAPHRYKHLQHWGHDCEAPGFFLGNALNDMATHPDLVDFARRAIGTDDVVLEQSQLMAKYAGKGDFDQRMHLDFGDHTLVYPRDDATYRTLPAILYYSDVTEELGPTGVLSQTVTKDEVLDYNGWTFSGHDETNKRHLYAQEHRVVVPAGSLLLYGMLTYHRGTAFRATRGARFAHFITYRAAAHGWLGRKGWAGDAPERELTEFITRATVEQRSLIGFPKPGDPYWTEEMVERVGERYRGMDMEPYRAALGA
jgi:ectoine hydroxylase-related dioxygenase (phytanoyl-CoA dioxygenase family)